MYRGSLAVELQVNPREEDALALWIRGGHLSREVVDRVRQVLQMVLAASVALFGEHDPLVKAIYEDVIVADRQFEQHNQEVKQEQSIQ